MYFHPIFIESKKLYSIHEHDSGISSKFICEIITIYLQFLTFYWEYIILYT